MFIWSRNIYWGSPLCQGWFPCWGDSSCTKQMLLFFQSSQLGVDEYMKRKFKYLRKKCVCESPKIISGTSGMCITSEKFLSWPHKDTRVLASAWEAEHPNGGFSRVRRGSVCVNVWHISLFIVTSGFVTCTVYLKVCRIMTFLSLQEDLCLLL